MIRFSKLFIVSLLLLGAAACGNGDNEDACEDVVCLQGTSCVVQDSGPACIPD